MHLNPHQLPLSSGSVPALHSAGSTDLGVPRAALWEPQGSFGACFVLTPFRHVAVDELSVNSQPFLILYPQGLCSGGERTLLCIPVSTIQPWAGSGLSWGSLPVSLHISSRNGAQFVDVLHSQ